MAALLEGLPVVYNSVVKRIRYCAKGVSVSTATHEFKGTHLGLLIKHSDVCLLYTAIETIVVRRACLALSIDHANCDGT